MAQRRRRCLRTPAEVTTDRSAKLLGTQAHCHESTVPKLRLILLWNITRCRRPDRELLANALGLDLS